jgi:hypothetical protein
VRSLLIAMLTACGSSPPPEAAPAPVEEPIAAPHVEPVVEAEPAPASALECSVDRWCRIHASGPDLEAIFAASATDVFAGGSDTTLLRWDGREWSGGSNPELTGANRTADVYAMHGADGLVLASGNEGYLTRFDGSAWSRAGSGTQADLHGVFVRSANDAWITGNGGTLLHFDGTDCTRERVPARGSLLAVWSAGAQVFVVGAEGELVHREESGRWRARPSGTTESLEAVCTSTARAGAKRRSAPKGCERSEARARSSTRSGAAVSWCGGTAASGGARRRASPKICSRCRSLPTAPRSRPEKAAWC